MKAKRIVSLLLALATMFSLGVSGSFADTGEEKLAVDKTVSWDPANPTTATVTITAKVPEVEDTKVLFIGTLCAAHGMDNSASPNTVEQSINAIAENADVKYYLLSDDTEGEYLSSKYAKTYSGEVKRNGTITSGSVTIAGSSNHNALKGFLNVLKDELITAGNSYDYIVLEFDGSRIALKAGNDTSGSLNNASGTMITDGTSVADQVAAVLQTYYDENKVIWITDGFNEDTSNKVYGQKAYYPRNYCYKNTDDNFVQLSKAEFYWLCALVAPGYYNAHDWNDSDSATYYGDGTYNIDLTSYQLTVGERDKRDLLYGDASNSYLVYNDNSRQMYYKYASELSDFLYMVVHGTDLSFSDQIQTGENVTVTSATLSATKSTAASAAAVADADWVQRETLTVAGATAETGSDGVSYVDSDDGVLKITTGNTDNTKNNLVTVTNADMKQGVTYAKLVVQLVDDKGFTSCISVQKNADGTVKTDADGNTLYEMNPNDGAAQVTADAGTNIYTDSDEATAVTVYSHKVESSVTDGTNAYSDSTATNAVTAQEADIAKNPYDGDTATLTYAPKTGFFLDSISIDGTKITLAADGTYTSTAAGYEASVTTDADGNVTVTLPDISNNRSVEVEYSKISLVKDVTNLSDKSATIKAGDEIVYSITVTNEGSVARSGITVSDVIDTSLVEFVSAYYNGVEIADAYDSAANTVTWSNISLGAKLADGSPGTYSKVLTLKVKAIADLTTDNSVKNTATGTYAGKTLTDSNEITVPVEPKDITVKYTLVDDTKPAGFTLPADAAASYGGKLTQTQLDAAAVAPAEGYSFTGWSTKSDLSDSFDSTKTLDNKNYTITNDTITLYGKWEYLVSLEKELVTTKTPLCSGDEVEYKLTVKNDSETALTNVEISDAVPSGLTYVTGSASHTATYADGTLTWTGISVPAKADGVSGETELTFRATINTLTKVTGIKNTATGEHGGNDLTSNEVSISAKPLHTVISTVVHGTNAYEDSTPANTVTAQAESITEYPYDGDTVTLTYAPDPDYKFKSITIITRNDDGSYSKDPSDIESTFTSDGSGNVTLQLPNIAKDCTVEVVYEISTLSIIKSITKPTNTSDPIKGGDYIEYAITVKNDGTIPRSGITITDVIDTSKVSFVSAYFGDGVTAASYNSATGTVTWSDISLGITPAADAPDGTVDTSSTTLTLKVQALSDLTGLNTITNTAKGKYNSEDLPDSNTTVITAKGRDLTVTYSVSGDIPENYTKPADVTATYGKTLTAEDIAAQAVTEIPGYRFTGWSKEEDLSDSFDSSKVLTEDNYTITNDTITLYGKWEYCVSLEKEILTSYSADNPIRGGDEIEYSITVSNTSSNDVTGVEVSDPIPANLTYVADSASHSASYADGVLTWTNLTLPKNSTTVLTFKATVSESITAQTDISNTATGTHTDANGTVHSFSDTGTVTVQPKLLDVTYHYIGFVPTGASPAEGYEDADKPCGTAYTAIAATVPDGYKFDGWYTDNMLTAKYTDGTALMADTDLYGSFSTIKDFDIVKSVTFNGSDINGATIAPNSTVTYSLIVTNKNAYSGTIKDIVITDTVPEGLSIVANSLTDGAVLSGNTITWTISLTAAGTEGSVKTLSFNASVPDLKVTQSYTNLALIASAQGETLNQSSNSVTFTAKPENIVLTVIKAWSDSWASHTGSETVTVKLYANGAEKQTIYLNSEKTSENVTVEPYDAAGTAISYEFKEIDPATGTPLNEGDSITAGSRYVVNYSDDGNGTTTITNNYIIDATDLNLEKTAASLAEPGKNLTYTITLTNNRTYETAHDVTIIDPLPAGLTLAENGLTLEDQTGIATPQTVEYKDGVVTWQIPELKGTASTVLQITVLVPADATATEYENVASITNVGTTSYEDSPVPSGKVLTDVRTFAVNKLWSNPAAAHSGVEVQLWQGDIAYGDKQTLSDLNGWCYTWTNMPLYDANKVKYTYTVTETAIDGYTTTINYSGAADGNTSATITNTLKTLSVSYITKGTDKPADEKLPTGTSLGWGSTYTAEPTLSAANYNFYGWYTDEDCTVPYTDGSTITEDTVLYGKWERKTTTVTEQTGTQGGPDPSEIEYDPTETVNQGDGVTVPAAPQYSGDDYTFGGWYTDPECTLPFTGQEAGEEPVQLYALWIENPEVKYTFVGYVPDGTAAPGSEKVSAGAGYVARDPKGDPAAYTFDGWYTDAACTKKFVDGTAIYDDTTLYGKWIKNPVVTYVYTGTIPTGYTAPASVVAEYNQGYTAVSSPSCSGYTFAGWYLDSACTVKYVDGTKLTANVTLYGKWTKNGGISTGDDYNGLLWTCALMSSAAGLAVLLKKKRYFFGE